MDTPFKEDYEIERGLDSKYYGTAYLTWQGQEKEAIDSESSIQQAVYVLVKRITQLEREVNLLKEQNMMQNLLQQNDIGRLELEQIFGFNEQVGSLSLEGLLSNYVDPNENSFELVRSARDSQ